MNRTWTFLLALSFLLASCTSRLPEQRPDDFYVGYSVNAGMMPYGSSVYISSEEASSSFFSFGVSFEATFQPQAADLDALYQTFVENQFNLIQSYEKEEIYDRGGSSITLSANGRTYSKTNGGMTFIKEPWVDSYTNVEDAIIQFMNRPATDATMIVFEWDENFAALYPSIHVDMGADFLSLTNTGAMTGDIDRTAILSTQNPNGKYEVTVVTDPSDTNPVSATFLLDVTQTQQVFISMGENGVEFKTKTP